jgi:endonuclease G, mitochondrial
VISRLFAYILITASCLLGTSCVRPTQGSRIRAITVDRPTIRGPFLIEHEEYTVCYDGRTKNPIWVYECITLDTINGSCARQDRFLPDPELPSHVCSSLQDYSGTGFDRGHLAAAANHLLSEDALDETFYLSNISPQVGLGFNRSGGLWFDLEHHIREVVHDVGYAHVISGPLYLATKRRDGSKEVSYKVLGKNNVAVPTHFFKILVTDSSKGLGLSQAWILPNRAKKSHETYSTFKVPVSEVLQLAGLDVQFPHAVKSR